jgi:preprotein translocase subunit SecG
MKLPSLKRQKTTAKRRSGSLTQRMIVVAGIWIALLLGLGTLSLAACEDEGPAERAGESVDNAAERAGEALEDTGEKVQREAE